LEAFQNVYQNNAGRKTNMGHWDGWQNGREVMIYKGGERCWGGPDRSTTVTLECGEENKVLDVKEPNKCEYAMKFKTPAACSEQELKKLTN